MSIKISFKNENRVKEDDVESMRQLSEFLEMKIDPASQIHHDIYERLYTVKFQNPHLTGRDLIKVLEQFEGEYSTFKHAKIDVSRNEDDTEIQIFKREG